jgi:formate dehydrogenase iron-sulfur subunit
MSAKTAALLFDMNACGGCHSCVKACMQRHDFPGDPEAVKDLSATACTALVPDGENFARKMCRHCLDPSCASVCPVGALEKTPLGPVVYDAGKCMGCRYCMVACPFDVPRYEWAKPVPAIQKCDMCIERLKEGKLTACAEACPSGATIAGTREELLAEAHKRIREAPEDYYDHVYGEKEFGGTSVLCIGPRATAAFGFGRAGTEPLPMLTWQVLQKIPGLVVMGGATLGALWWITKRRDEVARVEAKAAKAPLSDRGAQAPDARGHAAPGKEVTP